MVLLALVITLEQEGHGRPTKPSRSDFNSELYIFRFIIYIVGYIWCVSAQGWLIPVVLGPVGRLPEMSGLFNFSALKNVQS